MCYFSCLRTIFLNNNKRRASWHCLHLACLIRALPQYRKTLFLVQFLVRNQVEGPWIRSLSMSVVCFSAHFALNFFVTPFVCRLHRGRVYGRACLQVRVCASPGRDREKDEMRQRGARVESGEEDNQASPAKTKRRGRKRKNEPEATPPPDKKLTVAENDRAKGM